MAADPSARRRVGRQCRRYASAADQSPLAVHDTSGLQPANRSARSSALLNAILPASPARFPDRDSAWLNRCSASRPLSSPDRSEEHTSELQSLMRISYAVFCLKKKKKTKKKPKDTRARKKKT